MEAAVPMEEAKAEPKTSRLRGKNFYLTWSDLDAYDMTPDHIIGAIENDLCASKWIVCWEKHANGHWHCHARIAFTEKVDSLNMRLFDIGGCHPNIQTPGQKKNGASFRTWAQQKDDYIMKDGKFVIWGLRQLPASRVNYLKVKADYEAFKHDHIYHGLSHPFPFKLPNGVEQKQPTLDDKKCNWLIVGDTNMDKSKWISSTFRGKKFFVVPIGKNYSGRFDLYEDQRVFIYNDHDTHPREEIILITDIAEVGGNAALPARYHPRMLETDVRRVVIIICNPNNRPSWEHDKAFQSRFNTIDLALEADMAAMPM